MAATHTDSYWLQQDPVFQGRVRAALTSACVNIGSEAVSTSLHYTRQRYAANILNTTGQSTDPYKAMFAGAVATDATCLSDATTGGTIHMTDLTSALSGALLVTDAHIDTAVSAMFNAFLQSTPV
jgi:hypothetical protein